MGGSRVPHGITSGWDQGAAGIGIERPKVRSTYRTFLNIFPQTLATMYCNFVPLLLRFTGPLSCLGFTYSHDTIKLSTSPPPCRALSCRLIYHVTCDRINSCHVQTILTTSSSAEIRTHGLSGLISNLPSKPGSILCYHPSSDEGAVCQGSPVNPPSDIPCTLAIPSPQSNQPPRVLVRGHIHIYGYSCHVGIVREKWTL